jgi:hypothetical protein
VQITAWRPTNYNLPARQVPAAHITTAIAVYTTITDVPDLIGASTRH